ncbi:hypothetical protein Tco_0835867 [Tanacetum coccineum]
MDFQNELNCLKEMLNLTNSNQDTPVDFYDLEGSNKGDNKIDSLTMEPSDTFLMGDEVISTTPARENDEFIKSSVDDLGRKFKINSPLGEQVVDFLIENVDVADLPRHMAKQLFGLLLKNTSLAKGMSYEPLGDDSKPRSYDPRPPESTPVIYESSLLVTPLPDPEQICLREVERFDHFFSLTQLGGTTRVMETSSLGFHHIPLPRLVAYSPKEMMYYYFHPDLTQGDGFGHDLK